MHNDGRYPESLALKVFLHAQILVYTIGLKMRNLTSRRPILGTCGVDVSITTYGDRTRQVWRTLETIGSGEVLPQKIYLWLEDEAMVLNPPPALRRLMRRGLEIKHCMDYGPHKKYFPYVMQERLERPLVTADDDVLYPPGWLAGLVESQSPDEVIAYRAKVMSDDPYVLWPLCTSALPSENFLATGVSGVLYPPRVLRALRQRGDEFMRVCPRADDFWLHYAAVTSGVLTRQVSELPATWWPIRARQKGLEIVNVLGGGNDAVAKAVEKVWSLPAY